MPKSVPPPADEKLPDSLLGYHIRRLSVVVMSDLTGALAPLDLKPAEASILLMIASQPRATQSEVGRGLGILRANMTPMIAKLTKRGLIGREPVDGRSQALHLSAAGRNLARSAGKVIRDHEQRLFGRVSPAAQQRLIAQLREIWQQAAGGD